MEVNFKYGVTDAANTTSVVLILVLMLTQFCRVMQFNLFT